MSFKLYGLPLSQPFRAVAWTLLQQRVPFQIQLTVPGAATKIGSLHESFLSKSAGRTGRIPLLEILDDKDNNDEPWTISESPAILMYLCERQQQEQPSSLYAPAGSRTKTVMDSYMHWHHDGTRRLTHLTEPLLRPDLNRKQVLHTTREALNSLEHAWLKRRRYIGGNDHASIADILAYEEIIQAFHLAEDFAQNLQQAHPRLDQWVQRMQELPFYAEAHEALTNLVSTQASDMPTPKRLRAANLAGLQAYQKAQDSYS